jgi:hypothetical protein
MGSFTDVNGNTYIASNIYGNASFSGTALTGQSYEIVLLKYDASGNLLLAESYGSSNNEVGCYLLPDQAGNMYITGYFYGTMQLGSTSITSSGSHDVFMAKLDPSGNPLWAVRAGGTSYDNAAGIAFDNAGNVYVCGYYNNTATFGSQTLTSVGGDDMFVAKYNSNTGSNIWASSGHGPGTYDIAGKICYSSSGYLYITGQFDSTVTIGNNVLAGHGGYDAYIAQIDTAGNWGWAMDIGSTINEVAFGITATEKGSLLCTGYFGSTCYFNNTSVLTSFGGSDVFILSCSTSGNIEWVKQAGSTADDIGWGIAIAGDKAYACGSFMNNASFDSYSVNSNGGSDFYIAKFTIDCAPAIAPSGPVTFCSPGSVVLNCSPAFSYQWYVNNVMIPGATNQSYSATGTGNYSVTASGPCGILSSSALTVTANALPSAAITPAGPTIFCSGGSVVLNAVVAANRAYQWKKGANIISGATLSSYTATTGGNYKVIVTNTLTGCSKTSGSATVVTVNALPAATITPQGPTTFCAGGSVVLAANTGTGLAYKWKKGSNFISGATLSNYTATTGGNYKVQVTNSNGCSRTSGNVAVSVPCKEGEIISENGFDLKIFPNPSQGHFVFEFSNASNEKISINIFDIAGRLILSDATTNSQFTIRNSQLAPGLYAAEIIGKENKKVLKLIKNN